MLITKASEQRTKSIVEKRKWLNCNVRGHLAKDCQKPKKKKDPKTKGKDGHNEEAHMVGVILMAKVKKVKNISSPRWYIDKGASVHMTPVKADLSNYRSLSNAYAKNANGVKCHMKGIGECTIRQGDDELIILKDVYYLSSIECRLMSVSAFARLGANVTFSKEGDCTVMKDENVLMTAA